MSVSHQFGSIVHADELGTLLHTQGCAIPTGYAVLETSLNEGNDADPELVEFHNSYLVACELSSQIIGSSGDTLNVVYLMQPEQAGVLVRGLEATFSKMDEEAYERFKNPGGIVNGES